MSQHDFEIANQGFPSFRSDLNSGLQALASNSAGATEPSSTYAYQFWYDETTDLLKLRNSDDDAWITLAAFDQTNDEWEIRSAVIQAVDSAGVVIKTDDGTTRIEVQDDGDVSIDSGTLFVDAANNRVGVGTTSPSTKLDVIGGVGTAIRIGSNQNETGTIQFFNTTASSINSTISGNLQAGNNGGDIRFATKTTSGSLTERMRLDASGNLLVGTTDVLPTSNNVEGIALSAGSYGGFLSVSRGGNVAAFNTIGIDGTILDLRKDGVPVGSIGTQNGQTYLASPSQGIRFTGGNMMPVNGSGTFTDDTLSIGGTTERFKDLYLSGGVYLGGTGSANKLDDYEEGTWTPVMKDSSPSGTTVGTTGVTAFYTKVGRFVNATLYIQRNDASSLTGDLYVIGLPFTTANYPAVNGGAWFNNVSSDWKTFVYSSTSVTAASFPKTGNIDGNLATNNWDDGRYIYASFSYITT